MNRPQRAARFLRCIRTASISLGLLLANGAFAANSTITVNTVGGVPGETVSVVSGTKLVVTLNALNNEYFTRRHRVQRLPSSDDFHTNITRYIGPEHHDGSQSFGFGSIYTNPINQSTSFEWTTLNLSPGDYRLVNTVHDEFGDLVRTPQNAWEFIASASFTIAAGISDDILPVSSTAGTVANLRSTIEAKMAQGSSVIKLFDMNGDVASYSEPIQTGQMLALAVDTSSIYSVNNRVVFWLTKDNGGPRFGLLEVEPFSTYVNVNQTVLTSDIHAAEADVVIQYFHMPELRSIDLSGQLEIEMEYVPSAFSSTTTASTDVRLNDQVAEVVEVNTGAPLETFTVKIVVPSIGKSDVKLDEIAEELEASYDYATKSWFAIDVQIVPVDLGTFPVDYAAWWNGLSHDLTRPLNPDNADDLLLIQHIYALELPSYETIANLKLQYAPQQLGDDFTVYMIWSESLYGGSTENIYSVNTQFRQPLFTLDYYDDVSGKWGRPTENATIDVLTAGESLRSSIVNVTVHELGHISWRADAGLEIGHANPFSLRQSSNDSNNGGLDNQWLRFPYALNGPIKTASLTGIGWADTVMSYSSDRFSPILTRIADDQLLLVLDQYGAIPSKPSIDSNQVSINGNNVTITGSASHPDEPASYVSDVSVSYDNGSSSGVIACSGTSAFTCSLNGLEAGEYTATLVAVDQLGVSSSSVLLSFNLFQCSEFTSNNDDHVTANRAYSETTGYWVWTTTTYYANGSGITLGTDGAVFKTLAETSVDYFEEGNCPVVADAAPTINSLTVIVNDLMVTVSGSASDTNNDLTTIELQFDNNGTWVTASGTESWIYTSDHATGNHSVEVRATDANNNRTSDTGNFVVAEPEPDTTEPVMTLVGSATIQLTVGDTYVEQGASATDDTDGDITTQIIVTGGVNISVAATYTVTYSVADVAGNSASVDRTVVVNEPAPDTTAPVITLIGSANIQLTVGDSYVEQGAAASDDTDGDITNQISISGSVDTNAAGTYILTYSVSDAAGNSASAIRTVEVSDVSALICESDTIANHVTTSRAKILYGSLYYSTDTVQTYLGSTFVNANDVILMKEVEAGGWALVASCP